MPIRRESTLDRQRAVDALDEVVDPQHGHLEGVQSPIRKVVGSAALAMRPRLWAAWTQVGGAVEIVLFLRRDPEPTALASHFRYGQWVLLNLRLFLALVLLVLVVVVIVLLLLLLLLLFL